MLSYLCLKEFPYPKIFRMILKTKPLRFYLFQCKDTIYLFCILNFHSTTKLQTWLSCTLLLLLLLVFFVCLFYKCSPCRAHKIAFCRSQWYHGCMRPRTNICIVSHLITNDGSHWKKENPMTGFNFYMLPVNLLFYLWTASYFWLSHKLQD